MSILTPRLIHTVTFERPVNVRDDDGVLVTTWVTAQAADGTLLADVPAEVLTGPGRESVQSGQQQADVAARIRVPWFPGGIPSSWRILWDGHVFAIHGIPDTDATGRREYRIKCTAGITDGE